MASKDDYIPEKFVVEIRKLQILQGEFNALLKWTLWGFEVVLMCTVIFASCGAVWGSGLRKIHMAVLAVALTVILSITFNKLASIYDGSAEVLRE